ncbi:hypothetical protein yaldo0001_18040 [Yersinia aldovae ATCC 35236]|nr:hypothetical protein yaldo0001_18040 [Yersinia aldovae ATCC 35236]
MFRALNIPLPVNYGGGFRLLIKPNEGVAVVIPLGAVSDKSRCHQSQICARFAKAIRT